MTRWASGDDGGWSDETWTGDGDGFGGGDLTSAGRAVKPYAAFDMVISWGDVYVWLPSENEEFVFGVR